VKLFCAALAGRREWFDGARELLERALGPVDLASDVWPFDSTDYYEREMGPGLLRVIYSFKELIGAENIVELKHTTNRLERLLGAELPDAPPRPVNLDPGYLAPGKLVLATTKDHGHRLYLRAGIYAEVTLRWRDGAFQTCEWTYPDYRSECCREFFARVRRLYIDQRAHQEAGDAHGGVGCRDHGPCEKENDC